MSFQVRMLNGVGVVATSKRNIKAGLEFDNYFPRPGYTDPVLTQNGSNEMTIDNFIPKVVRLYLSDTEKISVVLKQATLEATLKGLFDFIYTHIQYKMDSPLEEQIRRPARSWADRQSGVDCDCYTVFISSVLTNLRIPHYLRMTAYNSQRGYQHIYVVVPKKGSSNMSNSSDYFTVDPVMDSFNVEKPYLKKHDKHIDIAGIGLNGFPVRMLNGNNNIVFANRTDLVEQDVYYSPGLDTWALKGLDGGYYIEGDYNRRYIEPLNGVGLGFINTGVGVDGFFKKIGKIAKKAVKTVAKVATKVALPMAASIIPGGSAALSVVSKVAGAVNKVGGTVKAVKDDAKKVVSQAIDTGNQIADNMGDEIQSQVRNVVQQNSQSIDLKPINDKILAANKAMVTSISQVDKTINDKISASNKAVVTSLSTVDQNLKKEISNFSNVFGSEVKKVLSTTGNMEDVLKNVDKISSQALSATASVKQQQNSIEIKTSELLSANKVETIQNEQFRNEQRNMNRITTIALVAVGVLLVIIIFKQVNK